MFWPFITEILVHVLAGIPTLAALVVLLIAARFVFVKTTAFQTKRRLLDEENPALGILFGAYLFGVALALAGTPFGQHQDETLLRFGKIFVEGLLIIALMRVSIWINDHLVLYRFCITKEVCEDRNLGVAFCVAGSCIASALVLNGALIGFSGNFVLGLRDIVIFWILGQAALVLGAFVYCQTLKYDVHQLIEYDNNVAVGLGFGALLMGLGLVVRASLVGAAMEPILPELSRTVLLALLGTGGVIAVQAMASNLVTIQTNYEEEVELHGNVAVGIVSAAVLLAVAMFIAAILQR